MDCGCANRSWEGDGMSPVTLAELDPVTLARVREQIPEVAESTNAALAVIENKEIISQSFSNPLTVQDIDALTDAALFTSMRERLRLTVQLLQPFCVSFLKRFKTAKRSGNDFHGYTDFNDAAEKLTGYSGRQVRNLAAGTPTPIKKAAPQRLTPAEKLARLEAERLQDKIDLATAHAVAVRNASNTATQTPSASPVLSAVSVSQPDVDTLLDYILKSIRVGTAPSITVGNKIYSMAEKVRFHRGGGL
jgi:hypothetical protein